MRGKGRLQWCDFCRQTETDLPCAGEECHRSFHRECIILSGERMLRDSDDEEYYLCSFCSNDTNDDACNTCGKDDRFGDMVLCDGCPKSYHLKCLKLKEPPQSEEWYCPICQPSLTNTVQVRTKGLMKTQQLGNVQICYVCQQGGRLLGCSKCPQSYHPKCCDPDILKDLSEEWICSLCQGSDPLKFMKHQRMTRTERKALSKQRQAAISAQRAEIKRNRDVFLLQNEKAIKPFVDERTLNRMKKNAAKLGKVPRNRSRQRQNISLDEWYECQKLVKEQDFDILNPGIQLKSYQVYGVCWLLHAFKHKGGAILADEMGLGKTIQTLALLSCLKAKGVTGPYLIVVPLSTVGNWIREIQKFVSHMSSIKICGTKAERQHAMDDPVAKDGCVDIYITTYETVVTEEWYFTDEFNWACIILDEAHRIKNNLGRIRKSLDRVSSIFRVLLTGTPLQNNVGELFTLLNFMFPDILKSPEEFEKAFLTGAAAVTHHNTTSDKREDNKMSEADIQTAMNVDERRLTAVAKLLQVLMLRRTKDEVVRLPPKLESDIWVPFSRQQTTMYNIILDIIEDQLSDGRPNKLLGAMIKMRLCCSHPCSVLGEQGVKKIQEAYLNKLYGGSTSSRMNAEQLESVIDSIKESHGEDHIKASSKLTFVDKLLNTLHKANYETFDFYREAYDRIIKDRGSLEGAVFSFRPLDPGLDDLAPKREYNEKRQTTTVNGSLTNLVMISPEGVKSDMYPLSMTGGVAAMTPQEYKEIYEGRQLPKGSAVISQADKSKEPILNKVLIFSQFRLVLSEIEKYLQYRGYPYMRLDGETNKMIRELDIREFNDPKSHHMVYLIGTRAGGMGINLASANHVVLYDEDWNPFVDKQAIDRAHRIGQTRNVHVWKLVTEWSIEEKMAFRRKQKLQLDEALVVAKNSEAVDVLDQEEMAEKLALEDIKKLIHYGSSAIRTLQEGYDQGITEVIYDQSLEQLIKREKKDLPEGGDTEQDSSTTPQSRYKDELIAVGTDDPDEDAQPHAPGLSDSYTQNDDQTPQDDDCMSQGSVCNDIIMSNGTSEMMVSNVTNEDAEVGSKKLPRRTTRQRRLPAVIYKPEFFGSKERNRAQIRWEDICFICRDKEFKKTITIKNEQGLNTEKVVRDEDPSLEFVRCRICPRVYHKEACLGLDKNTQQKSFRCPWHECNICFRKSSQAGGLLIHCASCPTSFCFDCFPTEYRRFWVEKSYFESLNLRGYNVNPNNLVTYLCSRCKALQHQLKRKMMDAEALKAELEREKQEQQAMREAAKKEKISKEERKKQMMEKIKVERETKALEKKKMMEEKRVEKETKAAERQRQRMSQEEKRKDTALFASLSEKLLDALTDLIPKKIALKRKEIWDSQINTLSISLKSDLLSIRDFVKTCCNCHTILHKSESCPYPPESRKLSHYVSIDHLKIEDGVPYLPDEYPYMEEFIDMPIVIRKPQLIMEVDGAAPDIASIPNRRSNRAFCALCGQKQHIRRHCTNLTQEQKGDYEKRKRDMGELLTSILVHKDMFHEQIESQITMDPDTKDASLVAEVFSQCRAAALEYVALVARNVGQSHIIQEEAMPYDDPMYSVYLVKSRVNNSSHRKKRPLNSSNTSLDDEGGEEVTNDESPTVGTQPPSTKMMRTE